MEEVSDRCCRPHRPTSRREGGRESPPTREGSGLLGATDPVSCGGRQAAQCNTHRTNHQSAAPEGGREEEEYG